MSCVQYYLKTQIQMNFPERRFIAIFKSFVDKVFVPQLNKMDLHCQQEWSKFSNMLTSEQINLGELQLYVETLPSINQNNGSSFQRRNKSPMFNKSRKETNNDSSSNSMAFNPSKTFGGVRSKGPMFPLAAEFDNMDKKEFNFSKDYSRQSREEKSDKILTTQAILPLLERIQNKFVDNHQKLLKIPSSMDGNSSLEPKHHYM